MLQRPPKRTKVLVRVSDKTYEWLQQMALRYETSASHEVNVAIRERMERLAAEQAERAA